jgi:hypothetical protein
MIRPLALLLALTLAIGCGGELSPERSFDVLLNRPGDADPLPVRVIDRTGTVVQVSSETQMLLDFSGRGAVARQPGQPNVLEVHWVGGACDEAVTLLVRIGGERRLGFELTTVASGEGCDAIGIGRAVRLTFAQPVPDDEIPLRFIAA